MNSEQFKHQNIYFLGIGGIGMSALARFFKQKGKNVAGYDKVPTPLTSTLEEEGISIHFDDDISKIGKLYLDKKSTLIVNYFIQG